MLASVSVPLRGDPGLSSVMLFTRMLVAGSPWFPLRKSSSSDLGLQVLSMSRLGGAGAVAQLVADVPLSAVEGEGIEGGVDQQAWEKWSNDGTEQEVAKLMDEDVGAAMQFLQSKAICIMPISLASAIFCAPQADAPTIIKPESNSHS
ncbi:hypothetical protein L6164_021036 [Bauhinia variegata]|uniref:Uncharacterized protein n=1 Tax=Bauhinia variegata TaxID=167791 RepID=A0ACB9MXF2_BAUVA|nr:hypothetical protein L6164_021036 [Bauhinia variegata]